MSIIGAKLTIHLKCLGDIPKMKINYFMVGLGNGGDDWDDDGHDWRQIYN